MALPVKVLQLVAIAKPNSSILKLVNTFFRLMPFIILFGLISYSLFLLELAGFMVFLKGKALSFSTFGQAFVSYSQLDLFADDELVAALEESPAYSGYYILSCVCVLRRVTEAIIFMAGVIVLFRKASRIGEGWCRKPNDMNEFKIISGPEDCLKQDIVNKLG